MLPTSNYRYSLVNRPTFSLPQSELSPSVDYANFMSISLAASEEHAATEQSVETRRTRLIYLPLCLLSCSYRLPRIRAYEPPRPLLMTCSLVNWPVIAAEEMWAGWYSLGFPPLLKTLDPPFYRSELLYKHACT